MILKFGLQAGKVTYIGENFLEKNRDSLPLRVAELLKQSTNKILKEIFSSSKKTSLNYSNIKCLIYYFIKGSVVNKDSLKVLNFFQFKKFRLILFKNLN